MNATSADVPARRYRIERYLTEGGMGAIYLGKKLGPGGFEKEVVLKQLLPEYTARPEFRDLFFREARISATLDHANIVHTFDLVESDESLFIVMEYVRGADLRTIVRRARLRRQELAPAAAIHVAMDVLAGLAYAHTRRDPGGQSLDIIHRDVSPSNILCSVQGEVKLSDFGIAKASTHSSVFYRVRGKVGYMSPEQARNEPIDHRSDLYSLAVCLHEALTAERLFVGDLSTPPDEIYRQPIAPVSAKRAGIPAALDEVLGKALAPSVNERYQSATELGEALREVAHRNGMAFSAPELADHLRQILGDDPERWLREEPAPAAPDTNKIPLPSAGHEGKEASSLGLVDDQFAEDGTTRDVLSPRSVTGSKDFDLESLLDEKRAAQGDATPPPGGSATAQSSEDDDDEPTRTYNNPNLWTAASGAPPPEGPAAPAGPAAPTTPPPVWTRTNTPSSPMAPVGSRTAAAPASLPAPASVRSLRTSAPGARPGAGRQPMPGAIPRMTVPPPPPSSAFAPPTSSFPPPPSIADPPTPPPAGEAVNIETPSPGRGVRTSSQAPAGGEFEDATPPPRSPSAPPPRPSGGWASAPGLPPPRANYSQPPAFKPPPGARNGFPTPQQAVPALRVPETIDFSSGGTMLPGKATGGPPRWFAITMLLGSLVAGAVLARRVTKGEVATILAVPPAAPRPAVVQPTPSVDAVKPAPAQARPAVPAPVPAPKPVPVEALPPPAEPVRAPPPAADGEAATRPRAKAAHRGKAKAGGKRAAKKKARGR